MTVNVDQLILVGGGVGGGQGLERICLFAIHPVDILMHLEVVKWTFKF